VLCPKCQHRNPDENRFCGQCGCELTKPVKTIYPREGFDEVEFPAVSDADLGIPRLRRKTSPLASSANGSTAPGPYLSQPAGEAGSPSFMETSEPKKAETAQEKRVDSAIAVPSRPQVIHGPSFLGLADPPDPNFLSDIEEPSHARRNWLLFALALVAVLAFAEWRNIRTSGLNLAGTMKLVLPHKKGEQPKPANTGTADTSSATGPATNGQPKMEVNPVNAETANQNSTPRANSSNNTADNYATEPQGIAPSQPGTATASPASNSAHQPTNGLGKSDSASPQKGRTADNQQLQNTAVKDNSSSTFADDNTQPTTEKITTKAHDTRNAHATRPKPAAPPAGEEELARAESSNSPKTAVKWLWISTSKGNLDAPVRLADMYAAGRGVPKDCEQATVLLRSSARRGNPRAAARLGMYYAIGRCVDLNRAQAWRWLNIAQKGEPGSDWIAQYRRRLWAEMTPGERDRAANGPTDRASE
jgi:TPR repeat protein